MLSAILSCEKGQVAESCIPQSVVTLFIKFSIGLPGCETFLQIASLGASEPAPPHTHTLWGSALQMGLGPSACKELHRDKQRERRHLCHLPSLLLFPSPQLRWCVNVLIIRRLY